MMVEMYWERIMKAYLAMTGMAAPTKPSLSDAMLRSGCLLLSLGRELRSTDDNDENKSRNRRMRTKDSKRIQK